MPALLISVRFHDGRYHGTGDWPPAPARLFQALVATAPKAEDALEQTSRNALAWLEQLSAPVIAAPRKVDGQPDFKLFVPNNDLDAYGGDIRLIAKVRTATKKIKPRLFDASVPLIYVWRFDGDDTLAKCVCTIADDLYQLGRGVDMAWANAEVLDDEAVAEAKLIEYQGVIYRPSEGEDSSGGTVLACPEDGSLKSLEGRYKAGAQRFRHVQVGRTTKTEFANAPKPRFRSVAYNSPPTQLLFDLRRTTDTGSPFAPWPLKNAAGLVLKLRDGAADKFKNLNRPVPFDEGTVGKVLVGRDATEADKALRVRIMPLPSIGHPHADRGIRRVLVEVPADCPIRADDVAWAFAGLPVKPLDIDESTGELLSSPVELVRADDDSMLTHYGMGDAGISSRLWRSVTPLALPAGRQGYIHDALQALRHAGLRHRVANIRVQREPFDAKGERAEAFAGGTRFSRHQLWHVEIEFAEPVSGMTVLGNGRYMGLGLLAPVRQVEGVYAFAITDGLVHGADSLNLARALRRAVMARVQDHIGKHEKLPAFFTGHEDDGEPARGGNHEHLTFVPDLARQRLLVIAPHVIEHRECSKNERDHLGTLACALNGLSELRAGRAGKLGLKRAGIDLATDPLFVTSKAWASTTPYTPTRHAKRNGRDSLHDDVLKEVQRRRLPVPQAVRKSSDGLLLQFRVAVPGPILLGKTMHFGGGLFTQSTELSDELLTI
jgi:CRISPR-associated protein Csb2